jgi:branched-chain amino acid transport system permease protein
LLKRLLKNFRWSVIPVPGRLIGVIFFVFLFFMPLTTDSRFIVLIFTIASLYTIFAVSWDLLSGYTGQVNFGHALFFGIAAYSSALMYKYLGWQPWATIPLSVLAAVAAGVLTCLPALRLRGPYLSLLTLAFPLMLAGIVMALRKYTGGEVGITNLPAISDTRVSTYYICLVVMTVSVLIMWKLTDAGSKYVRTGLIFHAIREDEIAARATGINTIRYKLLAFAIGGFFAGLAGALYGHVIGAVNVSVLVLATSFQAIIWVIFGGIVSIYGAVVGVYTLYPLVQLAPRFQRQMQNLVNAIPNTTPLVPLTKIVQFIEELAGRPMIVLSVLVILILLFMPEGVAVWVRDKIERECPRCKLTNAAWRKECRACGANLRYEKS